MAITGIKYDIKRDIKDTAKMIRKEIKARFPQVKASVRISRYSMGQSVDVTIEEVKGFSGANEAWLVGKLLDDCHGDFDRLSREALDLRAEIQDVVDSYNRQDIDSMTDYYNVHFFGRVNFDSSLVNRWNREALSAMGVDDVERGDLSYLYR